MHHALTTERLPRSGNTALASGALIQAVIGFEFLLAGVNKAIDTDYVTQFRGFVGASPVQSRRHQRPPRGSVPVGGGAEQ